VADQFAGRQAKCPGCSTPVLVPTTSVPDPAEAAYQAPATSPPRPAAPPPAPPPPSGDPFAFSDSGGAPRGQAPMSPGYGQQMGAGYGRRDFAASGEGELSGWKALASGLRLFQIGVMIYLGAITTGVVLLILMMMTIGFASVSFLDSGMSRTRSMGGSADTMGAILVVFVGLLVLVLLAVLTSWILALIGSIYMLQVPESTGGKPFPITILICMCVVMVYPLLVCAGGLSGATGLGTLGELLSGLAWLTATIMMIIFMHKIGTLLQSDALRKQAVRFAIWYGVTAGVIVVGSCGIGVMIAVGTMGAMRGGGGESMGGALVVVVLFALVMFGLYVTVLAMYSALLGLARNVIQRKAINPDNA
jgi:hypothetical protein